jgi:hypothetical protein
VTHAEIDRIRRAIVALQKHRSGTKPLPPEHEGRALDIVTQVATTTGLPVEDVLAGYDPDPRVGAAEGKRNAWEALLDLDEAERERCLMIVRRLERFHRKSDAFDTSHLPVLWSIAHDQAIAEVTHERASGRMNGYANWDDESWGGRKDDAGRKA